MTERTVENNSPTYCRRCGLTPRAAIAGVPCEPANGGSHDFPPRDKGVR